jgi:signal transduction histidine kinase
MNATTPPTARNEQLVAADEGAQTLGVVLSSLGHDIAVLDRTGTIVAVNDAWNRRASAGGSAPSVGVGVNYLRVCRNASSRGDQSAGVALAGIEGVLSGEAPHFSLEYECSTPSSRQWFLMTVTPLWHVGGGAVVSHTDVTSRKTVEIQMDRLREALAHVTRVATLGELTASLSHELSQPLTSIRANAEAARRHVSKLQPRGVEVLQETLDDIAMEASRAGEIISRVRAMLRNEIPQAVPLDVSVLLSEVLSLLRGEMSAKCIRISREDSGPLPVRGDAIQLQQVLLNLLLNAIDAMSEGPADQRLIVIRGSALPSEVRIEIQDTGTGILDEHLEHLFEPFFTTKPSGMGMGLTVCSSIVASLGGRLWAANNRDRGATFFVALPPPAGRAAAAPPMTVI